LEEHQLEVDDAAASTRLDVFAASRLPGLSRSRLKRLIEAGLVNVDGRLVRPAYQVKAGQVVELVIPPAEPVDLRPEPIPLTVLFEDEHLIVVNKQPGLVVHPAPGHYTGTLVHALLHHCPDLAGVGGELRPGIVHRLDKDTSGVLVATKTDQAHQGLVEQFKDRRVTKTYLALVWGRPPATGEIDRPIGRHPVQRHKMAVDGVGSRAALTRWRVEREWPGVSRLEVDLLTGRTHQIRVHLAFAGFPVLGDETYGGRAAGRAAGLPEAVRRVLAGVTRQMLHARRIEFEHPAGGRTIAIEAPPAPDLAAVMAGLDRAAAGPGQTDAEKA
jgi:23S rRNA pseudouridine1911/1915/1917 synthase